VEEFGGTNVLGIGLAICGACFPTGIAILRFIPKRTNGNSVTESRCIERQEAMVKVRDSKLETVNTKINGVRDDIKEITKNQREMFQLLRDISEKVG